MAEEKAVSIHKDNDAETEKGKAGSADQESAGPPVPRRARWGGAPDGEVPAHIALCLLHRMAIQTSVSPICRKLLQSFEISPATASSDGESANQSSEVADKDRSHPREDQNEAHKEREERKDATEMDSERTAGTSKEEKEEDAVKSRLGDLEGQMAALQAQLKVQEGHVEKQRNLVHRLQDKQDIDTARASQQGDRMLLLPTSGEREAPEMLALQTRSLALLSSLRAYVEPAALGLRLHAAGSLCHAANEARVLVAILLSEQGQLQLRLDTLQETAAAATKNAAAPAAEAAHATTNRDAAPTSSACASSQVLDATQADTSHVTRTNTSSPASEAAKNSESTVTKADSVASAPSATPAENGAAASTTSSPNTGAVSSEMEVEAQQELREITAQVESNVALVLEMTTAGVPLFLLSSFCVCLLHVLVVFSMQAFYCRHILNANAR
jgi:hypothetical protein